jgi:tripartite-type tricarboxylate transporter receptor subunit TctC
MKLPRRNFLHLAAGAAALPTVSRIARAQTYPSRPVHWIVSFAAGGANDIVARIVGQYLSDHLGQQFIIENRSGAGGNVGMQSMLSSVPDGVSATYV